MCFKVQRNRSLAIFAWRASVPAQYELAPIYYDRPVMAGRIGHSA
jgi:hypothetical protein